MNKRKKSYYERFMAMSDAERDAEVAKLNREFLSSRPLTAAQRAQHRRAQRKAGRPIVGKGAKRLTISMELGLLERADRLAKRNKLSRSELIARGIRTLLRAG